MANFYVPADSDDARVLAANRATVWPAVLVCVLIVAAVIAACAWWFGIVPTLVGCIVLAIAGLLWLIIGGALHACSKEETERCATVLPGHDVFQNPSDIRITGGKSYDADCAPSDLFPYIVQMNLTKAGFYSFQHFERFFGFHIRNDYTLRPEWQHIQPGDWMYYHQNGAGTGIVDVRENEYIITYSDTRFKPTQNLAIAWRPKWLSGFAWTWNFVLEPSDDGEGTHFVSYLQAWWPEDTSKLRQLRLVLQWGLPSNFMMNGMAHKMIKLAEADARARRAGKPLPGYRYRC